MKRNTTPTLPIRIHTSFDDVQSLEFVFAKDLSDFAPVYLHKKFETKDKIPVLDRDTSKSFFVNLELTAEETMKIPAGEFCIDTRVVLTGGKIPETRTIVKEMEPTAFREVYGSDRSIPTGAGTD